MRTTFQEIILTRLNIEFGCDISDAAGLSGAELDEWIIQTEEKTISRLRIEPGTELEAAEPCKRCGSFVLIKDGLFFLQCKSCGLSS